jgi:hypothetical protein
VATLVQKVRSADATAPLAANVTVGEMVWNSIAGVLFGKRADGTVVACDGGQGAALSADNAAIASTTQTTVSGLSLTLPASSVYVLEWDLDLTVATTTETFGVNVTGPSGVAGNYDVLGQLGTATVGPRGALIGTALASTLFGNNGSATALQALRVRATVRMGVTAGAVNLQLAGSTTGAIVVKANSSVVATRIA